MDAPILDKGWYSVLSAELSTGIVLTTNGSRFVGKGEVFWKINSIKTAEEFINQQLKVNPDTEYSLFNYQGKFEYVKTVNGKRK